MSRLEQAGVWITTKTGTMWAAIVFAILTVPAMPGLFPQPVADWTNWLDQALLPLVLVPAIMVGQNVQSAAIERVIRSIFDEVTEELTDLQVLARALHIKLKEDS